MRLVFLLLSLLIFAVPIGVAAAEVPASSAPQERDATAAPQSGAEQPTAAAAVPSGAQVETSGTEPASQSDTAEQAAEAGSDDVTAAADASSADTAPVEQPEMVSAARINDLINEQVAMTAAAQATAAAAEARNDALAARVNAMEQLLLSQHDREIGLYRETIRWVTYAGIAFAALCMTGLLTAAFLNYRAVIALQSALVRPVATLDGGASAPALLPSGDGVPGMERVQASGRRFQSRMSSLEQRLAELEDLAGRESVAATVAGMEREIGEAEPVPPDAANADEAAPARKPFREVPRALILAHKAQVQMNLGQLNEALATLDAAAALDANKLEVHLTRGKVLEKLGRFGDALEAYDAAVRADETNTNALLMKAGVLNRQERYTEALSCYERALEVHRASA